MKAPLFPITLAFCVGILLSRELSSPISQLFLATLALLLLMWLLWLRKKTALFFGVAVLTFLSLGILWPAIHEASFESNHLRTLVRSGKIDLAEPVVSRGFARRVPSKEVGLENRSNSR